MKEKLSTPTSTYSKESIQQTTDSRKEWVKPEKHPVEISGGTAPDLEIVGGSVS
ncbi:MAG: hypothetical protein KKG00_15780 [Bacteroidetes bacterium]|nr:hypothetical protein [Bacteroidota bacterium]